MLRRTLVAATTAVALLAGCTAGPDPAPVEGPRATPTGPSEAPAEGTAAGAEESATLMPDLKGMGLVQASEALGEVEVE